MVLIFNLSSFENTLSIKLWAYWRQRNFY